MALIVKVNEKNMKTVAGFAAEVIKNNGVVAFPTETSYALGVLAEKKGAVKSLRKAKSLPNSKPISIIVSDVRTAKRYGKIRKTEEKLIKKFMPGPLTLVVKKKKNLSDELCKEKVAFRISSGEFAMELSRKVGKAITATSANVHGKKEAFSAKEVTKELGKKVDLIIDAGKLRKRKPSTIFDCTNGKILREGALNVNQVLKTWKKN